MKILALPPLAALLVASCSAVPAGVPSYAAVVSDLWRDLGGGESHGPVCGLMTTTPLGAAHLVEGVIFPPHPSSPLRWWWSFALFGEFLFLRLPSLGCIYIVRLHRSSSGGCFAGPLFAGEYLPPFCSGGCFAAPVVLVGICLGQMLCRCG